MAYVGGSIRYLSDQTAAYDVAFRAANGRQREIESYEVLDLQAGVDFGRYTIELYGKNLTDSDGKTSTGALGDVAARRDRHRRDPAAHLRIERRLLVLTQGTANAVPAKSRGIGKSDDADPASD